MNCPCPFGAFKAAAKGFQNATAQVGGGGNLTNWLASGGKNILTGWLDSARKAFLQALKGVQKWVKKVGVDMRIIVAGAVLLCVLLFCLCGCCCWLLCRRKRRKVVSYEKRYENGDDSGGETAESSGCCGCCFRKQKPRAPGGRPRGVKSGEYTNGFHGREANLEDDSNDRTSLLSERQPPVASSQVRAVHPQAEWRPEDRDRMAPWNGLGSPLAEMTPWQEAGSLYGGMPRSNLGYPDYPGADPYRAPPGYSGSYPSGPSGGDRAPPGYSGSYPSGPNGGGYAGRYVDTAPYGGLLEPSLQPGLARDAGYLDPRGGKLYDYAPQPLHPPPPQYYQQSQAYGRGPGMQAY